MMLITRPAREATQWVQWLRMRGIAAQPLPLITIASTNSLALQQARSEWRQYRAVMFVSRNAVLHFFDHHFTKWDSSTWTASQTRIWAPGPGTVTALLQTGLPARRIDSPPPDTVQFDSEALWSVVAPQITQGDRVLIVRGSNTARTPEGNGRSWLAARLTQAGATVDCVATYVRSATPLNAQQKTLAAHAVANHYLWLFSSVQAIAYLQFAMPEQHWSRAHALTTHPRIAHAARMMGFGNVRECRPTLEDVHAACSSAVPSP